MPSNYTSSTLGSVRPPMSPYPLFLSAVIAIASKVYSTMLLHLIHQDCSKVSSKVWLLNHTTTFDTLHNYICYFLPSRLYQRLTNLLSTLYCTLFFGARSSRVGVMCCTDTLCAVETKMLDKCKLQEAATTASKRELLLKCNFWRIPQRNGIYTCLLRLLMPPIN